MAEVASAAADAKASSKGAEGYLAATGGFRSQLILPAINTFGTQLMFEDHRTGTLGISARNGTESRPSWVYWHAIGYGPWTKREHRHGSGRGYSRRQGR